MFYYIPAVPDAYFSIKDLQTTVCLRPVLPQHPLLAYWVVTVGTDMAGATLFVGEKLKFLLLGGYDINQNTLQLLAIADNRIRWQRLGGNEARDGLGRLADRPAQLS